MTSLNSPYRWHRLEQETFIEQLEWASPQLKLAVRHAREFAQQLGLPVVSAAHLLMGFLHADQSNIASRALLGAGVTYERLREYAFAHQEQNVDWSVATWVHPELESALDTAIKLFGDSAESATDDHPVADLTAEHLLEALLTASQTTTLLLSIGSSASSVAEQFDRHRRP